MEAVLTAEERYAKTHHDRPRVQGSSLPAVCAFSHGMLCLGLAQPKKREEIDVTRHEDRTSVLFEKRVQARRRDRVEWSLKHFIEEKEQPGIDWHQKSVVHHHNRSCGGMMHCSWQRKRPVFC